MWTRPFHNAPSDQRPALIFSARPHLKTTEKVPFTLMENPELFELFASTYLQMSLIMSVLVVPNRQYLWSGVYQKSSTGCLIYPSCIRRRPAGASSRSIYPNSQMSSSPAETCQNKLTLATNLFWNTRGWILTCPWQSTIPVVTWRHWRRSRKTNRKRSINPQGLFSLMWSLGNVHKVQLYFHASHTC